MSAYYNEHDPFAAAWLRNLIAAGLIPPGDVDERDIQLVQSADLAGYVQCHFFAGIGGWAYALQLAEWPTDRPVWTGSCPCQPYSAAGKGEGADDARNLWPHWFRLIRECRPSVLFGEQVEAAIRHGWLDAVSTDLEAEGYAFGASVLGAHSVGAPHIRQRVFFVAESTDERYEWSGGTRIWWAGFADGGALYRGSCITPACRWYGTDHAGMHRLVGDSDDPRPQGRRLGGDGSDERTPWPSGVAGLVADALPTGRAEGRAGSGSGQVASGGGTRGLADPDGRIAGDGDLQRSGEHGQQPQDGGSDRGSSRHSPALPTDRAGVIWLADASSAERWTLTEGRGDEQHGHDPGRPEAAGRHRMDSPWADLVWLPCRDGKARPAQPGIFPLAHGIPNRVGTLRGAGNAISPQVAEAFVRAYMEASRVA